MRDYCSERWEQRRTVCTPQSSFTGRGRNRRRRLFTTQKSLLLPFLTESHRLFSPEVIRHLAISLLWGGDEVTNVGRAITTPRRAELFWPEGNTPLSWISSTRVVLTHLRVPYLSHHTLGTMRACGPSTCLWTCVVGAAPQAMKTTNEQATDGVQEKR